MRFLALVICLLAASLLSACSPTFDWRETPIGATSLISMFPCKPDRLTRRVALGGKDIEMHMTSCDVAGVTMAVANARVADSNTAGTVLTQWRDATLAGMRANAPAVSVFQLERADLSPQSVTVKANGQRPDGRALAFQGAWFAQGTEVFAALLYSDKLDSEVVETFFSGLRFQ